MLENSEWTELLTIDNLVWGLFFVSMFGPPLYALVMIFRKKLGFIKKSH